MFATQDEYYAAAYAELARLHRALRASEQVRIEPVDPDVPLEQTFGENESGQVRLLHAVYVVPFGPLASKVAKVVREMKELGETYLAQFDKRRVPNPILPPYFRADVVRIDLTEAPGFKSALEPKTLWLARIQDARLKAQAEEDIVQLTRWEQALRRGPSDQVRVRTEVRRRRAVVHPRVTVTGRAPYEDAPVRVQGLIVTGSDVDIRRPLEEAPPRRVRRDRVRLAPDLIWGESTYVYDAARWDAARGG